MTLQVIKRSSVELCNSKVDAKNDESVKLAGSSRFSTLSGAIRIGNRTELTHQNLGSHYIDALH